MSSITMEIALLGHQHIAEVHSAAMNKDRA